MRFRNNKDDLEKERRIKTDISTRSNDTVQQIHTYSVNANCQHDKQFHAVAKKIIFKER